MLPSADTAAMLFWALLASGQINMLESHGWQTLATNPIDQPIDRQYLEGRQGYLLLLFSDFVLCAAVAQTGYPFIDGVLLGDEAHRTR